VLRERCALLAASGSESRAACQPCMVLLLLLQLWVVLQLVMVMLMACPTLFLHHGRVCAVR
jgi:hypothetical protein